MLVPKRHSLTANSLILWLLQLSRSLFLQRSLNLRFESCIVGVSVGTRLYNSAFFLGGGCVFCNIFCCKENFLGEVWGLRLSVVMGTDIQTIVRDDAGLGKRWLWALPQDPWLHDGSEVVGWVSVTRHAFCLLNQTLCLIRELLDTAKVCVLLLHS